MVVNIDCPESRLAEPKTRGKGGAVYLTTLVVALDRACATTMCLFPAGRSGAFAPRGYALGRSCRRVFIGVSKVEDPV